VSSGSSVAPCTERRRRRPDHRPDRDVSAGAETILLVEDEASVRNVTKLMLESSGYNVLPVAHPDEAIRICGIREQPIDLLVTDVVMPGMSGRVLAERMTALRPQLNVFFVSGYTDDAMVRHGISQRSAFLAKPFSADELALKVREILDSEPEELSLGHAASSSA
jgi:Response regulator containing CheY-like receiver, AAA-type ATPase, and DNA-binding domains